MSDVCRNCGMKACSQCSSFYDPRIPIEIHYRYSCGQSRRKLQLKLDADKVSKQPPAPKWMTKVIDDTFREQARKGKS